MINHRLPLFVIFILVLMFMDSALLSGVRCDDWPSSIQAASDEGGWRSEIYHFLNDDNCDYVNSVSGADNRSFVPNQTTSNDSANNLLESANKLYLAGSYERAAESYAKAVNLDPTLSVGWLNLGNSLYLLGRYQASLNAYNAVLRIELRNPNALLGKKQALLALSKTGGSNISTGIPSAVQDPKNLDLGAPKYSGGKIGEPVVVGNHPS